MTIQEIVDYLDAIPHSTFSFTCNDNQIIIFFAPLTKTKIELEGFNISQVNNVYKIKGEFLK